MVKPTWSDRHRCVFLSQIVAFLCLVIGLSPISVAGVLAGQADKPLIKVSLLPHWIPQAQFAGHMVALEKGFYRDAGIDLTLMRGGPDKPPLDLLLEGKATFCTCWLSTAMQLKARGAKIVNIGQIVQKSGLLVLAKRKRIQSLSDLSGKRIGCWEGDFSIQPLALFRQEHLSVKVIPMYRTVSLFLKGAVDAMTGMWYNEYHALLNSGFNPNELTVFFLSDHGLNFPEDGLYCLEETYKTSPELCVRLAEASIQGWRYALDHREEALDIAMRLADLGAEGSNRSHQSWMLNRMLDIIFPGNRIQGAGRLEQDDYHRVGTVLHDLDLITRIPEFGDFYKGPK
jgi:NitT/TauT family transport system substrate-binding protein